MNGHAGDTAKRILATCMMKEASTSTQDIEHLDPAVTLIQMLDRYEERFLPAANLALAQTKFEQAQQLHQEAIMTFHGRLRALYLRAYPLAIGHGDAQLVRKFATSLRNPKVREEVMRSRPATYAAALTAAQNEVSVQATAKITVGLGMDLNRSGKGKPHRQEEEEKTDLSSLGAEVSALICWNCDQPGHRSSQCDQPPKAIKRPPTKGTRGGGASRGSPARGGTGAARGRGGFGPNYRRQQVRQLKTLLAAIQGMDLGEEEPEEGEEDVDYEEDGDAADEDGGADEKPDF